MEKGTRDGLGLIVVYRSYRGSVLCLPEVNTFVKYSTTCHYILLLFLKPIA